MLENFAEPNCHLQNYAERCRTFEDYTKPKKNQIEFNEIWQFEWTLQNE